MSTNTALPPAEMTFAQETAYYAQALSKMAWRDWALGALLVSNITLGFSVYRVSTASMYRPPVVVRVNDIGRAETVNYHYGTYTPQDGEIKYFVSQFLIGYYSRNHRTTVRDYPRSLYFLTQAKLNQVQADNNRTQWYGKFQADTMSDDMDVEIRNIAIDPTDAPKDGMWRTIVDFDKVYSSATGGDTKREHWTCVVVFSIDSSLADREALKSNFGYMQWNPLGFVISDIRPQIGKGESEK